MTNHKVNPWEDPRVFEINRLPMAASALRCPDRASALAEGPSSRYQSLNGSWKFRYLPSPDDLPVVWTERDYPDADWDDISLPGVWQLQGYGKPYYRDIGLPPGMDPKDPPGIDPSQNSRGCYRRWFTIPQAWEGLSIRIHFGGVKAAFQLWLNGESVGYSQDSWLPAEFEVTQFLRPGENQISVLVYRFCDGSCLEDQDMWYLNGIFRDVYLYALPATRVEDFYFRAEFDETYRDAVLLGDLFLTVDPSAGAIPQLAVELLDPEGKEVFKEAFSLEADSGRAAVSLKRPVESVQPWSAERPTLYTILLSLLVGDQPPLEVIPVRFGFRQVEIKEGRILLNGKPILIKGVNRHEFDGRSGYTLSRKSMGEQVNLLKRYNINAVRTSHYPDHPYFYELCDRVGIYVMDEANLESHSLAKRLPRGKAAWREAVKARGTRMVLRDRNHPSILFWSLGNEAGQGENFGHMRRAIQELDHTRPIHYEGEYRYPHSDLVSMMYPSPSFLEKLALGKRPLWFIKAEGPPGRLVWPRHFNRKPILICEYAHAMGNSLSRLDRFMEIFERYPNCAGGYIWDLIDQSLLQQREDGPAVWTYGGDWEDRPTDGYFCINGLFQPDLKPNPAAHEVRKLYQPLGVSLEDPAAGVVSIHNKRVFTDLGDLLMLWSLIRNGEQVQSGRLPAPSLPPGQRTKATLPYSLPAADQEGTEYHLLIEFVLRESTSWAEEGYRVAWAQVRLPDLPPAPNPSPGSARPPTIPMIIHPQADLLEILVQETRLSFDTGTGLLGGLILGDDPLLLGPLQPNFYRELDNDLLPEALLPGLGRLWVLNRKWDPSQAALRLKDFRVEREEGDRVLILTRYAMKQLAGPLRITYQIGLDGSLAVQASLKPRHEMLRFGFQVPLAKSLSATTWFGKGPHETMPDRKASGRVGIHRLPSQRIHHNYIHPQENGNRSDVRWVEFTAQDGHGLRIAPFKGRLLNFSLWPYTQEDLLNAEHIHELPQRDCYSLQIDLDQRGVGDLFSLMYGRDAESRLLGGQEYHFGFWITPVP